jgi:hypothetical protein
MPTMKPTLLLDFANSRQLGPLVTFSRASTATRFNKLGLLETAPSGAPRFDYAPVTLACRKVLEESRTNLFTRSQEFNDAAWTKSAATVSSNAGTAPDGTLTADKLIADATLGAHTVQRNPAVSGSHAFFVFAKAAELSWLSMRVTGTTNSDAYFNVASGVLGTATNCTASISALSNGWFLCAAVVNIALSGDQCAIRLANGNGGASFTGDGTSGLFIWGAQLEAGAFATSYIPTAGSQVTRATDILPIVGAEFSSIYNPSGVTLCGSSIGRTSGYVIATIHDGTANNRIRIERFDSSTIRATITVGGVVQATLDAASTFVAGVSVQWALAFSAGSASLSVNGGTPVAGAPAAIPTVDRLDLGLNQWVRRLAMYPARLASADVQALAQ